MSSRYPKIFHCAIELRLHFVYGCTRVTSVAPYSFFLYIRIDSVQVHIRNARPYLRKFLVQKVMNFQQLKIYWAHKRWCLHGNHNLQTPAKVKFFRSSAIFRMNTVARKYYCEHKGNHDLFTENVVSYPNWIICFCVFSLFN